eukprot:TRINITY_DN7572_c0_g2_i1.p1 TRINITY_DN7572_c0_g2~~TRINITY_DN7572_c0_g2_i1.p1  ORF type:complete len:203 (+),score=33.90 TRINITY_DN7572_c0_g2_i1:270-878(+)
MGDDWSDLQPLHEIQKTLTRQGTIFTLSQPYFFLTQFSLSWQMPVKVVHISAKQSNVVAYPLRVELQVDHDNKTQKSNDLYRLTVEMPGISFASKVRGTVNECYEDLEEAMPSNLTLYTCWNCKFSSFNPYGLSHFGGLGCFVGGRLKHTTGHGVCSVWERWNFKDAEVHEHEACDKWQKREVPHKMYNLKDVNMRYRPNIE